MIMRWILFAALVAVGAWCVPSARAIAPGPDLIISDLPDAMHTGSVGRLHGYSIGFEVCNAGDANASWVSFNNQHPVEGWNLYRMKEDRIEQIGLSWLKHGFFVVANPGCGPCDPPIGGNRLAPGCQDVYDADLNAYQPGLGPRWEVNPSTGVFPFPPSSPGGPSGNAIYKMCRVAEDDLRDPRAIYIAEGQIVHPQDAAAGNAANNNSYRRVTVDPVTLELTMQGATAVGRPAIYAWRDHGLGVDQSDPDVEISVVDVPGDGRFLVASRVLFFTIERWRYEYAIQNLTSHRAASGFFVPTWRNTTPANFAFRDVIYHSGEPFNGFDWPVVRETNAWGWACAEAFAQNPDANALRWGTMYTFGFDSCAAPGFATARLDLFRPGGPASMFVRVLAPAGSVNTCPADLDDGFANGCPDGGVTIDDLIYFLVFFAQGNLAVDLDDGSGAGTPDGGVTVEDLLYFFDHFAAGC